MTKLLVYIEENSGNEIKTKIYSEGYNKEIMEKTIKISPGNVFIIVFGNIRNINEYNYKIEGESVKEIGKEIKTLKKPGNGRNTKKTISGYITSRITYLNDNEVCEEILGKHYKKYEALAHENAYETFPLEYKEESFFIGGANNEYYNTDKNKAKDNLRSCPSMFYIALKKISKAEDLVPYQKQVSDHIKDHTFLVNIEEQEDKNVIFYFSILTSEKNSCSLQGAKTGSQHRYDPSSVTMLVPTLKKTFSTVSEGDLGMKNHGFKETNNYKKEKEEDLQKFKQEILKNKENFINFDFTEPLFTKSDVTNFIHDQNTLQIDSKAQNINNDYPIINALLANEIKQALKVSLKQVKEKEEKLKIFENDTKLLKLNKADERTHNSLTKSIKNHKEFQFKYSNKEIENFADTIIPIKNNIHNPSEKKNYSDDDNLE